MLEFRKNASKLESLIKTAISLHVRCPKNFELQLLLKKGLQFR